jgi:tetratricopeptide (TPR) repeat protein
MSLALILAPLLAQVGPTVSPGAGRALPQAPLEIPRRASRPFDAVTSWRLGECMTEARADPAAGLKTAQGWQAAASGAARAEAALCLATSLSLLDRTSEAEAAYLAARDLTPPGDLRQRALLAAMAGEEALKAGAFERAEAAFGNAHAEAKGAAMVALAGEIAAHRSRALVGLGQLDAAAALLAEARRDRADYPLAWLLSATLARRQGKLAEAQMQIETAARLDPADPAIGVEAGVIAMLGGRETAARRSWQSAITAAPGSAAAKAAQSYLDQLGPEAAPPGR